MAGPSSQVKKVVVGLHGNDSGSFLRLYIPNKQRLCAPCSPEHNLCLEGVLFPTPIPSTFRNRESIHLLPQKDSKADLTYPAVKWLRERISEREWTEFIGAVDAANLEGTIHCAPCLIVPCAFPLLLCQPCCCWLPNQYAEGRRVVRDAAMNLVVAKFNRYLFIPRGMLVRRQHEYVKAPTGELHHHFIRIDTIPSGIETISQLEHGMQPGTMKTDLRPCDRNEWLSRSDNIWPCWSDFHNWCAWLSLIPEPRDYMSGTEPDIIDEEFARRYFMSIPDQPSEMSSSITSEVPLPMTISV